MSLLDRTPVYIQLWRGLRSRIDKLAASNDGVEGEPRYTTDDKHLWVHDGSVFQPVQTLDLAVTYNDEVVCNNGEVVYSI